MKIKHVDHVGINVDNLEDAKLFFTDLGFTLAGEFKMQSEMLDRVTGLKNVRTEFAMLQSPDAQLNLEVIKYHQPADSEGARSNAANTLGIRHIAFQVEDLDGIVDRLKQKGRKLVGDIQTYEDTWKLCYVRGPEGIIIELAEQL
ncbi:VOC family protein [Candidatus Saccharibacteria bacterium]|nr:VOC family protein [Candidatus Saccharibacteria bacterium]